MIYGRRTKVIANILLIVLFHEIIIPLWLPLQATIQPEAFGSSGSSQYVDPFTGQFNYSIPAITVPGPNGSDYTLDLTYNSGIKPEEEASWVGWGWNLSPGSISRIRNGIPDDLENTEIIQLQTTKPHFIASATLRGGAEIFERKPQDPAEPSVGLSFTSVYNSMTGFSFSAGVSANYYGASGNLSFSSDGIGYGLGIDYFSLVNRINGSGIIKHISSLGFPGSISGSIPFSRSRTVGFTDTEYDTDATSLSITDLNTQFSIFSLMGAYVGHNASHLTLQKKKYIKNRGSGYLFSGKKRKSGLENNIMDYSVENERPFRLGYKAGSTRPLPIQNADMFYVSGKGPNGTFRAFHTKALTYAPKKIQTSIRGNYLHFEAVLQSDLGLGFGLGNGGTTTKSIDHIPFTDYYPSAPDNEKRGVETEAGYYNSGLFRKVEGESIFRFINDPGQPLIQSDEHQKSAQVSPYSIANGNGQISSATTISYKSRHQIGIEDRSVAVSYNPTPIPLANTNDNDMSNASLDGSVKPSAKKALDKSISEFTLHDNGGTQYVYGYSLYSHNEHELSFITDPNPIDYQSDDDSKYAPKRIIGSNGTYVIPKNLDDLESNKFEVIGQIRPGQYAASYLPSFILSNDYVDVDGNGASPKDAGSYIRFTYRNKGFVKWRQPYCGFFFNNTRKTDGFNRLANVSYGQTQVTYPATIRTKTHIAYFITNKSNFSVTMSDNTVRTLQGSNLERKDAIPPNKDETIAGTLAARNPVTVTENPKEYLERIELYSINELGKAERLIKKVHFSYDYSLQKNAPGSVQGSGKLTLLSVWDETMETVPSHVAKFEFNYHYPTTGGSGYVVNGIPSSYVSLYNEYNTINQSLQNPDYNPEQVDRWGYYQQESDRYASGKTWNNQVSNPNFDPAAWHLKRIVTPTGGQIHIQYEQHDYLYVQDRRAMVMCKFNIIEDIGLNAVNGDGNLLRDLLTKQFGTGKERMFGLRRFHSESHKSTRDLGFYIPCSSFSSSFISFPSGYNIIDVAEDFYGSYSPEESYMNIGRDNLRNILPAINLIQNCYNALSQISGSITENGDFHYMRVPVVYGKKGGGVRVKRILFYTPQFSLENSGTDAALYGQEYNYKIWDTETNKLASSGVATNEPDLGYFENSLIRLRDDTPHYFDEENLIIFGEDKTELEGPLGREYLPSPSIGYSNVIVTNINKGSSAGGFSQYEYYTAKDFPSVKVDILGYDFETSVPFTKAAASIIPSVGTSNEETYKGNISYKIQQSQRHGLPKTVRHFGGIFDPLTITALDLMTPSSSTEYEYYDDASPKLVMYHFNRPFRKEYLGHTVEHISERKMSQESYIMTQGEGSVAYNTLTTPAPTLDFGVGYSHMRTNEKIETIVNSIIINDVPFLKKVTTTDNGAKSEAEYIAFDPINGQALVTKTKGYYSKAQIHNLRDKGSMYTFSLPAYRQYPQLASKSLGEMRYITQKDDILGNISMGTSSGQLSIAFEPTTASDYKDVLNGLFTQNTVLEVFANKDDLTGKIIKLTGATTQGGSIASFGYAPINNTNIPPANIEKIVIHKSGFENRTTEICQSVSVYGIEDEIKASIEYADKLFKGTSLLANYNNYLFNSQRNALDVYNNLYWQQNFTHALYDPIKENNIVQYSTTTNIHWGVQCHEQNGNGQVALGFFEYNSSNYSPLAIPSTSNELREFKTFSRGAQLQVNDDKDIVLSPQHYGMIGQSSEKQSTLHKYQQIKLRCGPRISSTNDCINSVIVGSERKNAFTTDMYNRVVSASAIRYRDIPEMITERMCNMSENSSIFPHIMRAYETYGYQSAALSSIPGYTSSSPTTFGYGIVTSFTPHDYNVSYDNTSQWQKLQTIKTFNEYGVPVTTEDAFGIFQTMRTDSWGRFPACQAVNAKGRRIGSEYQSEIYFQSFEKNTGMRTTGNWTPNRQISHTGYQSAEVGGNSILTIGECMEPGASKQYLVSFWATDIMNNVQVSGGTSPVTLTISDAIANVVKMQPRSSSGQKLWRLFQTTVTVTNTNAHITLANLENQSIYIDDVKIQPIESAMTCYVYDESTYVPVAMLDDNHFAMEIQYDMRGVPVRSLMETYSGWKTVSENTANTPKLPRPHAGVISNGIQEDPNSSPLLRSSSSGAQSLFYENRVPNTIPLPETQQGKFNTGPADLLRLHLTPDTKKIHVLGIDTDSTQKKGTLPKENKRDQK